MKKNQIKNKNGFTLVELLISLFVFSLIVGVIMNIFISGIESQKKILRDQKIIGEISYVMEYISRSLRMAMRDNSGNCISGGGYNYETKDAGSRITFLNYKNECQEYYLENNKIYERKSSDNNSANFSPGIPMTSSIIFVEKIIFDEAGSGWHSSSNDQPKVMINLQFKSIDDDSMTILQTTVSQRNVNVN